jgi:hypothetical protein
MDETVPIEQSQRYAEVARDKGALVELVELPAGDHFVVIDKESDEWRDVRDRLDELFTPPTGGGS